MNAELTTTTETTKGTKWIVRVHGWAVFFHTNACGHMYELVPDERATVFTRNLHASTAIAQANVRNAFIEAQP